MFRKMFDWARYNIINIVVFLACIIFIAQYFGRIAETHKTIGEIISSGAIVVGLGFMIVTLRGEMGFINGRKDPDYIGTMEAYGDIKHRCTPHCELLDVYCEWKNKAEVKRIQTEKLNSVSLIYSSFEDGSYNEGLHPLTKKPLSDEQLQAIKEAREVKITPLTPKMLFSEYSDSRGGFGDLMDSTGKFRTRTTTRQLIKNLATGIIGGLFTIERIKDPDWGGMLWAGLVIIFILIMSVFKEIQNYQYIVTKDRSRFIRKTDYLWEFYNMVIGNSSIFTTLPREDEKKKDGQPITQPIIGGNAK